MSGQKKDPTELSKFSGKDKEWRTKKRAALAYLSQCKFISGVPLIYIVHSKDNMNDCLDGSTNILDNCIVSASLTKSNFELYQFLVSWTVGGTAVAHLYL
jgi:hypothetical protein